MKLSKIFILFLFIWVAVRFGNLRDLTTFLNTLPIDQATTAKIAVDSGSNTFCNEWWLVYNKDLQ